MRLILAAATILATIDAVGATESTVGYNVASGSCRVIALPVSNKPVLMTAAEYAPNLGGVAQATVERQTAQSSLFWVGFDFGGTHGGNSATPNTHMLWLDWTQQYLDVRSASNLQLQVCNSAITGLPAKGYLTFVY
jgi:hypothetical protein